MRIGETLQAGLSALRNTRGASADSAISNHASTVAAPVDPISLYGVSEAELTPAVRAALTALMSEVDQLKRDRDRLAKRVRNLEDLADTDPLVSVFNRRAFVRELARVMSFAERYNVMASLVFFDLNGFKEINDRYGHAAGDAVLRQVGAVLVGNVRESDVVGRVGGDEFAVILAQSGLEDSRRKGAFLARQIANSPATFEGQTLTVTASVGAYTFEKGDTAERILARADEAMYADKISSRGN